MSESLKEKAKTLPEWHVEVRKKGETNCGCCSSIGTKDACCDCAVILSWHPKFIEVSVAQQDKQDTLKTAWSTLEDECKRIQDEIDRGCYSNPLDIIFEVHATVSKCFEELLKK